MTRWMEAQWDSITVVLYLSLIYNVIIAMDNNKESFSKCIQVSKYFLEKTLIQSKNQQFSSNRKDWEKTRTELYCNFRKAIIN